MGNRVILSERTITIGRYKAYFFREGINNGYIVDRVIIVNIIRTFPKVSEDECKRSFLQALEGAESQIELLSSDGLTFPKEVDQILAAKLLEEPPVTVSLFLLSAEVLCQIEGEMEKISLEVARQKIDDAKLKWTRWWRDDVEQKAGNRAEAIRRAFHVTFVNSPELGHMNGSVLIDRKVLRVNVHRINQSSSRGALLYCNEFVNLVPLIQHYIHDMRRFGTLWKPWEEDDQEVPR